MRLNRDVAIKVLPELFANDESFDDGRIVYARAGRLYAVGFDLSSGTIHGAPAPVLDGVVTDPANGAAWYDVTRQGLLAYVPGGRTESVSRFSWEGPGLFEGTGVLGSISYRAHMLGFSLDSGKDGADAYVVPIADDGSPSGKPKLVAGGPGEQSFPAVSADGTLVAYQTVEAGRSEVCVVRLDDPATKRRLTNDGGDHPRWNRDGSRLFYGTGGGLGGIVSLKLRSASELRFDDLQAVTVPSNPGQIVGYDVASDGTSVLVGRIEDPLLLRRDIRIWPGWGKTLPSVR